ncbi:hypothetical protein Bca4012_065355 [Brassica carinata]
MEDGQFQAREAGVFSRVQLPFEPKSRQSLLADRSGRDCYHSQRDRQVVAIEASATTGMIAVTSLLQRDLLRGPGDNRWSSSRPRNNHRYAPYATKKSQTWMEKSSRTGLTRGSTSADIDAKKLGFHEDNHQDGTLSIHTPGEPSDLEAAPRSSGRKFASTIVSPFHGNNDTDGDGNVTFRRKSATRAIDISPMENDMINNDMNNGPIIEALHDMDIGGSGNMGDQFQESRMDIDGTDDLDEDLLGEELKEMATAHHLASSSSAKAKSIKARSSSRGVSRHEL